MVTERRQTDRTYKRRVEKTAALLVLAALLFVGVMSMRRGDPGEEESHPPEDGVADVQTDRELTLPEQILAMAETDSRFAPIAASMGEYPQELLELALKNTDAVDFVAGYPAHRNDAADSAGVDLGAISVPGAPPLLMQWDSRWGYAGYGSGIIGLAGCGPTCLSMVVLGLTGDTEANPLSVAQYSDSQGWYLPGFGSDWELMRSGAEHYGLRWKEVMLDEGAMRRALEDGRVIIASMTEGDFTDNGHFIVLSEYENGAFRVLDPNSYVRSARTWSFAALSPQVDGLWAYWVEEDTDAEEDADIEEGTDVE